MCVFCHHCSSCCWPQTSLKYIDLAMEVYVTLLVIKPHLKSPKALPYTDGCHNTQKFATY